MHSGHRALWVPEDGRHEVFALSGPRVARAVDCRSAHSKNALKTPLESQSVRALAQILPSSQVSGDGSRSRAGHPLSHRRSRAAELRSARSGHKTRLPPSVEAGFAEEPNGDTAPPAVDRRTFSMRWPRDRVSAADSLSRSRRSRNLHMCRFRLDSGPMSEPPQPSSCDDPVRGG
jgi:hypothetical protein